MCSQTDDPTQHSALEFDSEFGLRAANTFGRYANHVRINAAQGSTYNGQIGVVARLEDRTAFVRFASGPTLPFGITELEVVS